MRVLADFRFGRGRGAFIFYSIAPRTPPGLKRGLIAGEFPYRAFGHMLALRPSKNDLWKGGSEKHEHLKKNVNIEGFRRLHGVGLTVFEQIL